jgi:Calcineurin-like phosphoesterase
VPDPERLLLTLRQAIWEFRKTPGRRGRVVYLEDATDVLVGGDLHGNLANLQALVQRAELSAHPGRHLVVQELVHGPHCYPTGGDKSHQALDVLAALKCRFPKRVHMLLGNHELAEWTGDLVGKHDQILNMAFREGIETAYGAHAAAVHATYVKLFAELPVAIRTSNRVFLSHSLPSKKNLDAFNPEVLERDQVDGTELKPRGSVYALLWGRDTSQTAVNEFLGKVDADLLITGHIPCADGFAVPNDRQIILDSMKTPAACCLIPVDRPVSHQELVGQVTTW